MCGISGRWQALLPESATFSLATSRSWNDAAGAKQEKTEWHRCVVWNTKSSQLADIVERYVKKGDKLYVEGRIESIVRPHWLDDIVCGEIPDLLARRNS